VACNTILNALFAAFLIWAIAPTNVSVAGPENTGAGPQLAYALVIPAYWALVTIVPTLALTSRRIHDAEHKIGYILLAITPFVVLLMTAGFIAVI
jgi:uncharacterized membrane protein YhaH (DUF805 family)